MCINNYPNRCEDSTNAGRLASVHYELVYSIYISEFLIWTNDFYLHVCKTIFRLVSSGLWEDQIGKATHLRNSHWESAKREIHSTVALRLDVRTDHSMMIIL